MDFEKETINIWLHLQELNTLSYHVRLTSLLFTTYLEVNSQVGASGFCSLGGIIGFNSVATHFADLKKEDAQLISM